MIALSMADLEIYSRNYVLKGQNEGVILWCEGNCGDRGLSRTIGLFG